MTRQNAALRFVSRGGEKLDHALERFAIDVSGVRALDAGASTGGFTDCLLTRGAIEVVAVDVAYGELAWKLRNDPRVRVIERTNVRSIDLAIIGGERADIVVADLAFISLTKVRFALLSCCRAGSDLVLLVKPQFEAPRGSVERGGVIRDPSMWRACMSTVANAYRDHGCVLVAACASPLVGPAGNREFFLHLRTGDEPDAGDEVIDAAIAEAP